MATTAPPPERPSGNGGASGVPDEMCQICRSTTYLNPNMRFLINSVCYHKICESCVDRIFSSGPAPCPYKGCGRILRRQKFKSQVFDDLVVEREVDIRQRLAKVYNRPEASFESEREYNDYLEHIESLVFTIMAGGTDAEDAEKEVKEYETKHHQEILDNALQLRQQQQLEESAASQEADRQRRLRLLSVELQNQEKEYKRLMQQEAITALAEGCNASVALQEAADRIKHRSDLLRSQYDMELERSNSAMLRKSSKQALLSSAAGAATPFTPFAGDRSDYAFSQQEEYVDPIRPAFGSDPTLRAGGFSVEFTELGALTLAFMSLDVDVQLEKMEPKPDVQSPSDKVTISA